ncbi:MAG: rhodanese-like domain-containing protein, partial [Waterburya sp.]
MLFAKKAAVIAVSVFVLSTISFGYQAVEMRSDEWKQDRIMTMYRQYAQEFPQVEEITVSELQQLQQQGQELILVDVRSPEERAVSFIPGAITTKEFEQDLQKYQDSTIVAYCTIGYRSGKYAQKMQQQG